MLGKREDEFRRHIDDGAERAAGFEGYEVDRLADFQVGWRGGGERDDGADSVDAWDVWEGPAGGVRSCCARSHDLVLAGCDEADLNGIFCGWEGDCDVFWSFAPGGNKGCLNC